MNIRRPAPRHLLCPTERRRRSTHVLTIFLILAVPGFLALAHNSWYLSPAELSHFQISAGKTIVSEASVHTIQPLVCQAVGVARPRLDEHGLSYLEDVLPHPSPSVTVSLKDRAPPPGLTWSRCISS